MPFAAASGKCRSISQCESLAYTTAFDRVVMAASLASRDELERLRRVTAEFINVDDFDPEELRAKVVRGGVDTQRSLHIA